MNENNPDKNKADGWDREILNMGSGAESGGMQEERKEDGKEKQRGFNFEKFAIPAAGIAAAAALAFGCLAYANYASSNYEKFETSGRTTNAGHLAFNVAGAIRSVYEGIVNLPQSIKEMIAGEETREDIIPSATPAPAMVYDAAENNAKQSSEIEHLRNEIENLKKSGLTVSVPNARQTIVEKTVERIISGITSEDLDAKINQLNDKIMAQILGIKNEMASKVSNSYNANVGSNFGAIALSQKIDTLKDVTITNAAFAGTISGLGGVISEQLADYLPLSGGTITGNLTVNGNLTVTSTTTFNGVGYMWPSADGSTNYVLTTDGSGALSWATVTGIGGGDVTGPSSSLDFQQVCFDGTTGKLLQDCGMIIRPEMYGAAGDGVTDDSSAFTAMLAAVTDGTKIELTAGKIYLVGNGFALTGIDNLVWEGNGATIKSKSGLTTNYFLTMTDGNNITIKNTTFNMQNAETSGQDLSALRFMGTTNNTKIINNDFSDSCYGVIFGGTHDEILIDGNRMEGANDYTADNAANKILDLDLVYFAGTAITNIAVQNNYGNQIWTLVLADASADKINIHHNTITNSHDSSIYARGDDIHIHHNIVLEAGKDGVKCFDTTPPDRCRVENNYLSGTGVHKSDGGYHIINFTTDGIVSSNEIIIPAIAGRAVSTQTGIIVESTNVAVENNKIKGYDATESSYGISLKTSEVNNLNIIIANNSIDTAARGINFGGNATYTINGLHIKNNAFKNVGYGIFGYSNGITATQIDNVYVDSNIFDSWVTYTAVYFNTANNVSVSNNKFLSGTGLTAIDLDVISHATVTDNKSDGTETTFSTGTGTTYDLAKGNYKGATLQEEIISDTAFASSWNGVTTTSPSKNAIYDEIILRAPLASPTFTGNVGIGTTNPLQKLDIEKGHIRLGQVAAPSAPTVAVGAAGVLTGNYYYRISFVTALGETESGTVSALVAPSSQQVDLSNIPVSSDSAVTARKIYRTTAGGTNTLMKLVAAINDNTTTTYTDNIADGSLGVSEPRVNSTGGLIYNGSVLAGIIDNSATAIGVNALRINTGYYNTAMGIQSLYSNTTGSYNTATGLQALRTNDTGGYNTAMGAHALYTNTGSNNSAMGMESLYSNTTGNYNIAIGTNALLFTQTGSNNTSVGYSAGYGVSTNSFSNNSLFGYKTGFALTTGSNNILVGLQAGNNLTTGNNNIILGVRNRRVVYNSFG